jgi:hypothetical protein
MSTFHKRIWQSWGIQEIIGKDSWIDAGRNGRIIGKDAGRDSIRAVDRDADRDASWDADRDAGRDGESTITISRVQELFQSQEFSHTHTHISDM